MQKTYRIILSEDVGDKVIKHIFNETEFEVLFTEQDDTILLIKREKKVKESRVEKIAMEKYKSTYTGASN